MLGTTRLAYLHILQTVLLADYSQHILLTALLNLPGQEQLVQYEVRFLEVEDDVQLAHVAVVLVHLLDVAVHHLERDQLVVRGCASRDEKE